MTSARRSSTIAALFLGVLLGGVAGYFVAHAGENPSPPKGYARSDEVEQIRAELAELKSLIGPGSINDQLEQLQDVVSDILLRGDEFSLRAEFARNSDQLGGLKSADFALRDADQDGVDDSKQLRDLLDALVTGKTPVAKAQKADSADNAEFLANLPMTDFALAEHSHATLVGDVRLVDNVRIDGTLAVTGNTVASGNIQVFGEVVAVGGLLPGAVNIEPKPAIAGMIRYNRQLGALQYCDGSRWHEIAVVSEL